MRVLGCVRRRRRMERASFDALRTPPVITDATRVRQIVANGLTNAVKYSNAPVNGAIRVVLRTGSVVGQHARGIAHDCCGQVRPCCHKYILYSYFVFVFVTARTICQ